MLDLPVDGALAQETRSGCFGLTSLFAVCLKSPSLLHESKK